MKLFVNTKEILDLLEDEIKYGEDCNHGEYDECCCTCQSKRILQARRNGELVIEEMKEVTV